jgi:hypothetical protein
MENLFPIITIESDQTRDLKFIQLIMDNTGLSKKEVESIVGYNVITPLQLSLITGRGISAIQNLMRPLMTMNGFYTALDRVYPFKIFDRPGPVFIHFNKKCEDYIIKALKLKSKHGRTNSNHSGERER